MKLFSSPAQSLPIISLLFILLAFRSPGLAQDAGYDSALAQKLGADGMGMKKYVMAFLYAGDRVSEYSPEQRAEIQKGHMTNIFKLADARKLVLAGPFFGNDKLRGIFVFDVGSLEEAAELTNGDPAVAAGVLKMELKEWYGSAALLMVQDIHKSIAKPSN